ERPLWNDTLRGILVALIKDRRPLWDVRMRPTKDRSIQLFRDIAAILSNQDSRMNEWYVLEKWCWMMEMYMRAIERPDFEWRFKGAMSFLMESSSSGVQYIDSLTPDLLAEATARYAETEAEVYESKIELTKKFRKGCAAYRVEMAICHRPCTHVSEPDDLFKEVNVKQEAPENDDSTAPRDISSTDGFISPTNEPTLAFLLSSGIKKLDGKELCQAGNHDVNWTSEIVSELIDSFKEQPALWHFAHPHYDDMYRRRELLCEIAKKLRKVPGGSAINEDIVLEKWRALHERFNHEHAKAEVGEVSSWEFYPRMLFLTPGVLSACRFDDLNGGIQPSRPVITSSITKAVDANIRKILGYVPNSTHQEVDTNQVKRPKIAPKPSTPKSTFHKESTPHVQQVVSTWVPPREDSIEVVMQPFPSAPPTATAQVTAKSEIGHILKNDFEIIRRPSPRPCVNGSKYGDFVPDQSHRIHEDKWTLMGRMIEETARELEAKNSELAFRLQKDINDVIFKYQIESLNHKQ
ncbi:MADF domain-containing protein, partial [Trichostrongylus colubriformis]